MDSSELTEIHGTLAHRLRSPLSSIMQLSELILLGTEGHVDEEALEDVRLIRATTSGVLESIDGIIDVVRVWSETSALAPMDLVSMARCAVSANETVELARARNRQIVNQVPEDFPEIWADGARMRTTLTGLLHAMLRVSRHDVVSLSATVEDRRAIIQIGDGPDEQGAGQEVSIGEFLHTRPGTEPVALDLLIAAQAALRHQGRFWMTEQPGEPSVRMNLSLPLAASRANKAPRDNRA